MTTGLIRVRSPLLAESLLMSFPPGTEMFRFPGFASFTYVFSEQYPIGVGCPIRISTDQRLLAAPRGFSQRATSFIASWCQGIHRMPLSRSRSSQIQPEGQTQDPPRTGAIHTPISRHANTTHTQQASSRHTHIQINPSRSTHTSFRAYGCRHMPHIVGPIGLITRQIFHTRL